MSKTLTWLRYIFPLVIYFPQAFIDFQTRLTCTLSLDLKVRSSKDSENKQCHSMLADVRAVSDIDSRQRTWGWRILKWIALRSVLYSSIRANTKVANFINDEIEITFSIWWSLYLGNWRCDGVFCHAFTSVSMRRWWC